MSSSMALFESCYNQRFRGMCHHRLQGERISELGTALGATENLKSLHLELQFSGM
jgi:hypothetical protein